MVRYLALTLCWFLLSCQPAFVNGTANESSPYFQIPVGSTLSLRKEIIVPPRTDRLYFQDGNLPAWYNVNKYQPYCVLQVKPSNTQARIVEPDDFVITSVSTAHYFQLLERQASPVERGTVVVLVAGERDTRGDNDYEVFGTAMELHSGRQPGVTRLTCADWGLPQPGTHITVNKIRRALGAYFRVAVTSG